MAMTDKELENKKFEEFLASMEDEIEEEAEEMADHMEACLHAADLDEEEIPKIEKIYFDMDGVLADFRSGVKKYCGMDAPDINEDNPEKDAEMWKRIREVDHFYAELDEMPYSRPLFEAVYRKYRDKVAILTAIPKKDKGIKDAAEDKIEWIRRKFSKTIPVHIVTREEKKKYCTGKGCILIDDMEKNILEWKEMGGSGFLNVDADNTLIRLVDLGIIDEYITF